MTLFLVGGGPSQTLAPVLYAFVREVRDRGERVAIALLGSAGESAASLDNYAEPIIARYPEVLIEPIWLTDEDEGPIEWPAEPENLAGLIVAGGWTPGYLEALSGWRETISTLVRLASPIWVGRPVRWWSDDTPSSAAGSMGGARWCRRSSAKGRPNSTSATASP